jgi:hypothetical protein
MAPVLETVIGETFDVPALGLQLEPIAQDRFNAHFDLVRYVVGPAPVIGFGYQLADNALREFRVPAHACGRWLPTCKAR